MIRALLVVAAALGALAAPRTAGAVDRFAVVIGNNTGGPEDVELRYAQDDARKMASVLTSLGGFAPENLVLLDGKTADDVRRALITVNDRIRMRRLAPDAVLMVYYSGHATADELHLGRTSLPLSELESLVRGSAASMRILVLDSCRSGSLTRVKGGERGPRFAIALDDRLAGEGVVFLTSSSANEDAQESDDIRGSFFTHYLVSALLGAGDADGDGAVSLGEAYRSAYDSTLRASSQTLTLQHPTFHYDVRGQGDLVLTRPATGASQRGTLTFPSRRSYLVFRGGRDGPVIGEVSTFDRNRRLSLEAGRYFLRGRGASFAVEGMIEIGAGETRAVDDSALKRIEYARLLRKGMGASGVTELRGGLLARTPIIAGESPCVGAFTGVQRNFPAWAIEARGTACRAGFANNVLEADDVQLGGELRIGVPRDFGRLTLEPAIVAGAAAIRQAFDSRGKAPTRWAATGALGASAALVVDLSHGYHAAVDASAATYLYRHQLDDRGDDMKLGTAFAITVGIGLGKYF